MKSIHVLKTCIAIPAFLYISGCASIPPETIKALEGQSASICVYAPTGSLHVSTFGGKSTGTAGGTGKASCGSSQVEFNNDGRAPKDPAK